MSKACTKCGETKSVSEFYRCKSKRDGYQTSCKACARDYVRKIRATNPEKVKEQRKQWGINNRWNRALTQSRTAAKKREYILCSATAEELKAAFTGKCDLCGCPEMECTTQLHMDHDHETGEFRGFLCARCNIGIGHFRDSEELLIDALHYLMNTNERVI